MFPDFIGRWNHPYTLIFTDRYYKYGIEHYSTIFSRSGYLLAEDYISSNNLPNGKIITIYMIRINSPKALGSALKIARKHLRLNQSDLALAAGVGLRFIVDLEAGKPTVRLEHVLRVIDALGGAVLLEGLAKDSEENLSSSEDADHAT